MLSFLDSNCPIKQSPDNSDTFPIAKQDFPGATGQDIERIQKLLAFQGSIQGAGYCGNHANSKSILSHLVSGLVNLEQNARHNTLFEAMEFNNHLDELLRCQYDKINPFFQKPEAEQNIFSFAQLKLNEPVRTFFSPIFYISMRQKEKQISQKLSDRILLTQKLWSFIYYPIRIANSFTQDELPNTWEKFDISEIYETGVKIIRERFPRLRSNSLHTVETLWERSVYGIDSNKSYFQKNSYTHHVNIHPDIGIIQNLRSENVEPDLSQPGLDNHTESPRKKKPKSRRVTPKFIRGAIRLQQHDSMYAPSCLPLNTIALIRCAVQEFAFVEPSNYELVSCLINFLIHTGRDWNWVSQITVSLSDQIPERINHPIYLRSLDCIAFEPLNHIGWPDQYIKMHTDSNLKDIAQQRDQAYQHSSLVYFFYLSSPLASQLSTLSANAREGDFLFQYPTITGFNKLDSTWVTHVLAFINKSIQNHLVGHDEINLDDFASTFDGLYSEVGFYPEHQWIVSGRYKSHFALAYWYAGSWSDYLAQQYHQASAKVETMIQNQFLTVARKLGIPISTGNVTKQKCIPQSRFMGSWRCARTEIIKDINWLAINRLNQFNPETQNSIDNLNTLTEAAIIFSLTYYGIRPFELSRTKYRYIDMEAGYFNIHGKPHVDLKAARRLPLLEPVKSIYKSLFKGIQSYANDLPPHYLVFRKYISDSDSQPLGPNDIDGILNQYGQQCGHSNVPEAYAWRHWFYAMLMEAGTAISMRNYWIGHEAEGQQTINVYGNAMIYDWKFADIIDHIKNRLNFPSATIK